MLYFLIIWRFHLSYYSLYHCWKKKSVVFFIKSILSLPLIRKLFFCAQKYSFFSKFYDLHIQVLSVRFHICSIFSNNDLSELCRGLIKAKTDGNWKRGKRKHKRSECKWKCRSRGSRASFTIAPAQICPRIRAADIAATDVCKGILSLIPINLNAFSNHLLLTHSWTIDQTQ